MRRTLALGVLLLFVICGSALASPARITLHVPPRADGTTPPDAARVARITADVAHLAVTIGERNHDHPGALATAEAWVTAELEAAGLTVRVQDIDGVGHNLIASRGPLGTDPYVLVGAHLDTAEGTPGADDNASGVAALLELARNPAVGGGRPVLYLVYGNEEPPFFQTARMGSRVHALSVAAAGTLPAEVWVLESIGHYRDEPGTQHWPPPFGLFMPTTANFILLVGNPASADQVQDGLRSFRAASTLPAAGVSVPGAIQGVDWSDHAEYWRIGLPAVMVTDMPPLRNPNYHEPTDLPDQVDPARIAAVVDGMEGVLGTSPVRSPAGAAADPVSG